MNQLKPYQHYPTTYQPALGGLFSWLRKAVNWVARAVEPFVPAASYLVDFTDGDGFFGGNEWGSIIGDTSGENWGSGGFFRTGDFQIQDLQPQFGDLPLTQAEEAILDAWVENKFTPFFTPYLSRLKGFIANPPSIEVFNQAFNETQEFIAVLKYYQNNALITGEPGYSDNMVKSRVQFLNAQIELLQTQLAAYMNSTGISVTTSKVNVSVSKSKYAALAFNTPNVYNVSTVKVGTTQTPEDTEVLISELPVTPTHITTKASALNWFLGIGFIVAVYNLTTKKNKN